MKLSEREITGFTVLIALGLFVCGLLLTWHAATLFIGGQTYTALKSIGFSIVVFGGCFDPINFIWLGLPFTSREVTVPTSYSRFGLPFFLMGISLIITGWVCDGWLLHPPAPTILSQPG